jgi:hypothetical protein
MTPGVAGYPIAILPSTARNAGGKSGLQIADFQAFRGAQVCPKVKMARVPFLWATFLSGKQRKVA